LEKERRRGLLAGIAWLSEDSPVNIGDKLNIHIANFFACLCVGFLLILSLYSVVGKVCERWSLMRIDREHTIACHGL
jgi:hypothetical protein